MSRDETALTRWIVYCQTHSVLQLDHRVFTPILDKLRNNRILHSAHNNNNGNNGHDAVMEGSGVMVKQFNECADCFVTQCVAFVRRHRHYMHGANLDKFHTQLEHILKCLHILHCLR